MPAADRKRREDEVAELKLRGLTWAQIEERTGVKERTGRNMVNRWLDRTRGDAEPADAERLASDALALLERHIADLAVLALDTKHDHVRLGALKAGMDGLDRYLVLMAGFGRLPRYRADFEAKRDIPYIFQAIRDVLERHEVSGAVIDDLMKAFEARQSSHPSPTNLAAAA